MSRASGNHKAQRLASTRLVLTHRAKQAIELLMDCNGHTDLTKSEFASALASRFGGSWVIGDKPNRRLVEDVMNLTRDQDLPGFESVKTALSGYVVAYAPSSGGMTLLDPSGDMPLHNLLHMLSGDISRQMATATINRRRLSYWAAGAKSAINAGDVDLGLLLSNIENEISNKGFTSERLVDEFLGAISKRGIEAWAS